jgi:hypothetical protein
MLSTLRNATLACALGLLLALFFVSQVSAQESGTLIVYEEAQGGDASFSFSGSGSLGSFQIATEEGGGAKVFDLPAGTYTLTQSSPPSGWNTQEIFADGTAITTTDLSQSKATFTVSSPADVIYVRYTNAKASTTPPPANSPTPSPSIPENLSLPLLLAVAIGLTSVLVLLSKKKRKLAPMLALFLSVLIITAFVGHVQATPDKYVQLGTRGNDEQTQFGTPSRDVIVQAGFGGNDAQYCEGDEGDDTIIQNGGAGEDDLSALAGEGNDLILQEGGEGADTFFAAGGGGNQNFTQNGGAGNDIMEVVAAVGNCETIVNGGTGDDEIKVTGNSGTDNIGIDAGIGDDTVDYLVSSGHDNARIDGGTGNDSLAVEQRGCAVLLLDESGRTLFSAGPFGPQLSSGDSTLTLISVEHGRVLGENDQVVFQW